MRHFWLVLLTVWLPHAGSAQSIDTTFDSNGVPIRYVMSGAGEPIVLIHGWSASSARWPSPSPSLSGSTGAVHLNQRPASTPGGTRSNGRNWSDPGHHRSRRPLDRLN